MIFMKSSDNHQKNILNDNLDLLEETIWNNALVSFNLDKKSNLTKTDVEKLKNISLELQKII